MVNEWGGAPMTALGPHDVSVAVEAAAFGVRDLELANPVPGGSAVGVVADAGEAAAHWLDRRVVVPRLGPCGECRFCRRGAPAGCADRRELGGDRPGTLAPAVIARARWLAECDGALEVAAPGAAILGDDALVAYTLYCRIGVAAGEPVVCLGRGPRTALIAQIARAKGARVATVESLDAVEGDGFDGFDLRPWRIFALDGGDVGAVPAGSSVALAAGARIDAGAVITGGGTILGGEHGHPDLLPELVALCARGDLDLDAVTEVVPADPGAVAAALFERGRIPVVSRPGA